MNNPGVYDLGSTSISADVTNSVITLAPDAQGANQAYLTLEGMLAASIEANFVYGSGGSTLKVDIETSLDQGSNWFKVGRFAFAVVGATKAFNLSGLSEKLAAVVASATPSDDVGVSGIFGTRWRASITSTGTYAGNTAIAVRLIAR